MKNEDKKDNLNKCKEEVSEILKKYNCTLNVKFQNSTALGQTVLVYLPVIEEIKK